MSNHSPHDLTNSDNERARPMNYSTGKLHRNPDKIVAGVCSGIAEATKIDVGLVRIGVVVLSFLTSGVALLFYLAAWAILPMQGESNTMLDSLIETGKKSYSDYKSNKDTTQPSSEPGPAPQAEQKKNDDTFNPYDEN